MFKVICVGFFKWFIMSGGCGLWNGLMSEVGV